MFIGRIGNQWGEKHRSKLFFVAFWASILSMALTCVALAGLSSTSSSVRGASFFEGTIVLTNPDTRSIKRVDFFASLTAIVQDSCHSTKGDVDCPPRIPSWSANSCESYFYNCDVCAQASSDLYVPTIIYFVTLIPQILTDMQRSTSKK